MKKLLLFATLLHFTALLFSQNKGDNAILIPAQAVIAEKITGALLSSGYPIDKANASYFLTQAITKKGSTSIKFSVLLKDSVYVMQGWFNSNMTLYGVTLGFQPIEFKGMKGSAMKDAWNEMATVARKINENITFIKQ